RASFLSCIGSCWPPSGDLPSIQPAWGAGKTARGDCFRKKVYEVAIPEDKVPVLRDIVCWLGSRLGQQAMYFDAPAPSVEIIELTASGGAGDEPGKNKTTGRRSKKNRPPG